MTALNTRPAGTSGFLHAVGRWNKGRIIHDNNNTSNVLYLDTQSFRYENTLATVFKPKEGQQLSPAACAQMYNSTRKILPLSLKRTLLKL